MIQGRLLGERQYLSWILKDKCERTEAEKTGYVEAPNCENSTDYSGQKSMERPDNRVVVMVMAITP